MKKMIIEYLWDETPTAPHGVKHLTKFMPIDSKITKKIPDLNTYIGELPREVKKNDFFSNILNIDDTILNPSIIYDDPFRENGKIIVCNPCDSSDDYHQGYIDLNPTKLDIIIDCCDLVEINIDKITYENRYTYFTVKNNNQLIHNTDITILKYIISKVIKS